jgi:amino acid transporter
MKGSRESPSEKTGKIGVLALAAIVFFTISGGPYGLEPLIGFGGSWSLPLLLITPLLWDLPTALMVLELNSMMPEEGGYYQWVKRALGLRWAFYEGWWTWLYTFVDLAIYPLLFVEYASYFFPELIHWKIPVCLAVIWLNALLNIRGIVIIGRSSLLLGSIVLIPFLILFILAQMHPALPAHLPAIHNRPAIHAFSMALFIIMWNYIGWDNATTYAHEIHKPAKSYIYSIAIAFGCIYILYLLAAHAAMQSGIDPAQLTENGFPYVGLLTGGKWLAALLSAGGMASMLGIFSAVLLSVSRVPAAMAADRLLPAFLTRHHLKYNTPYISIILCAIVTSFLVLWSFEELIVIDITLYAGGIALEFISLILLRKKNPDEKRPFKIPLKDSWLVLISCLPLAVFLVALAGVISGEPKGWIPLAFAVLGLLSAHLVWMISQKKTPVKW